MNLTFIKKKIVWISLVIIIMILVIIYAILNFKKEKTVIVNSNLKDAEVTLQTDQGILPVTVSSIANITSLSLPTSVKTGKIVVKKDGYLDKIISVDDKGLIGLVNLPLIKAEEIILAKPIATISPIIIVQPSPIILSSDPNKIYYLGDDNKIMLLDNNPDKLNENPKEIISLGVDENQNITQFNVSPDSKYLFFQTLNGASKISTKVVDISLKEQKEYDIQSDVIWSSDNMFFYLKEEENSTLLMKSTLNFSNPSKILDLPVGSSDLIISPDNKYISIVYKKDGVFWGNIYDTNGKLIKEFNLNYNGDALPIAKWSSNSQKIAFFNNQNQIFIYDVKNLKDQIENTPVVAGIFSWKFDGSNYYYLINNQNLDMPYVVKDKNNKKIAEFIEAPESIVADKNGNLNIITGNDIERINIK